MKILVLGVVGMMLLNAQSPPDPADLLEQARDEVIARLPPLGYACIATINRSYFRRRTPLAAPASCERISADRIRNRTKWQLVKTDRLRLQVVLTSGGEVYSWPGPGGYSRNVEEVLHSFDIGAGALATHLDAIFANPSVRFRLLGQDGENLEFGFRVPIEASKFLVQAGDQWRETGYAGSLAINSAALELKSLSINTEELPEETSLCESSTTLDYPASGEDVLLPSTVRGRDLNRDNTETEWTTSFSDCRESSEKPPERPRRAPLPLTRAVPFKLALTTPIDTSTAAAGDVIKARVLRILESPSSWIVPVGAALTGRIMRLEHYLQKPDYTDPKTKVAATGHGHFFLIWLDFDTMEANGVVSSIRARLTCGEERDPNHLCPVAIMSNQKWDRALAFGGNSSDANVIVPVGYTSTWLTGDPQHE